MTKGNLGQRIRLREKNRSRSFSQILLTDTVLPIDPIGTNSRISISRIAAPQKNVEPKATFTESVGDAVIKHETGIGFLNHW